MDLLLSPASKVLNNWFEVIKSSLSRITDNKILIKMGIIYIYIYVILHNLFQW